MKITILSTSIVLLLVLFTWNPVFSQDPQDDYMNDLPNSALTEVFKSLFKNDPPHKIQHLKTREPDWDVYYVIPSKTYRTDGFAFQARELLKQSDLTRATALFFYGTSKTYVVTNQVVIIHFYPDDPYPMEWDDAEAELYPDFLRIFCRIPLTKNYDPKTKTQRVGYDEKQKIESDCEKKLIAKTWRGHGPGFAIHKRYESIWTGTFKLGETRLQSFLAGVFQFLSIIIPAWILFFPAYRMVRFYHETQNPIKHSIAIAAVAVLSVGFILLVIIFGLAYVLDFSMGYSNLPVNRDLAPTGWSHYATTAGIISTFYCISAVIPFAGLINYYLLGKRTFPLWFILLGFILAPILFALVIFGLGGKRSSGTTHTRTGDSGGSSSSGSISGGGGTFGGGGASGKW